MPTLSNERSSNTKHTRLADELRQQIVSGGLRPGDRLPSFSELRAQHGITLSTIEKILTTLEREGMVERFHGKGVFVTHRRKSTKCIGFVSPRQGTSAWGLYWVQFLDGLQECAHDAGFHVLLISTNSPTSWQDNVDGAIFHEMTAADFEKFELQATVNVLSSVPGVPSVVADEFAGAHQAVQHLLELGHRKIAYLIDDSYWPTQMRLLSYRSALVQAGINAAPEWVRTFKDESGGKEWGQVGKYHMQQWLADGWRELGCTALLCHNDEVAIGVMEAIQEAGLRIPEDISLVGYDGTILCETSQPKLTSIKVPLREIGARAAKLLIEQIETGVPDVLTLSLPTELQVRGSTARV